MKNRSIKDVVATFSIVAADPETEELGIAVQSKFIAVGSVVPWAKAGLGAVGYPILGQHQFWPEGAGAFRKGGIHPRSPGYDAGRR